LGKYGLTDQEIVDQIKELLSGIETVQLPPIKKKYAEVIISESFV